MSRRLEIGLVFNYSLTNADGPQFLEMRKNGLNVVGMFLVSPETGVQYWKQYRMRVMGDTSVRRAKEDKRAEIQSEKEFREGGVIPCKKPC